MSELLKVENLHVNFHTYAGEVKAVRGVSFSLEKGEVLAIVGESGCGKTVTSKAIMRLLDRTSGEIEKESVIELFGKNMVTMPKRELNKIRGKDISMIFQDSMTSLNPTMTIGKQIMENILVHEKVGKQEAKRRALELLKLVEMPNAEERLNNYPHQMSGGMRQRAMIAVALACNPKVLIADEPTTALDVTIQAQLMDLLKNIQKKTEMAVILVTHDLGVVGYRLCMPELLWSVEVYMIFLKHPVIHIHGHCYRLCREEFRKAKVNFMLCVEHHRIYDVLSRAVLLQNDVNTV